MLTGPIVAKAMESAAASYAKGAALAKGKDLLARFDNYQGFLAAVAEDREQILWTLLEVIIAVGRAVSGKDLDGEPAVQALLAMATDPSTVRRFRALLNEASTSTDERVAMLATGYFVGAQTSSLRDRLDWAVRSLFPDDASALASVIECRARLGPGEWLTALELKGTATNGATWFLVAAADGVQRRLVDGLEIPTQSLRALHGAQCLAVLEGVGLADPLIVDDSLPNGGQQRAHSVDVLPLGLELHRTLGTIDWRAIARRRTAR